MNWLINAMYVEKVLGCQVDYQEKFYICPECEEPVYSDDWSNEDLSEELCPICGFGNEE